MNSINSFCSIVKILENPIQIQINNKISITTCRVEFFQIRKNDKNQFIFLSSWGKLSNKIKKCCNINDYILIEGYLSIREKKSNIFLSTPLKQTILNVLKVYII